MTFILKINSPDLLRDYRKLDDSITMRLNRAAALAPDENARNMNSEKACLNLWLELVGKSRCTSNTWYLYAANWTSRKKLIEYCVDVVDHSFEPPANDQQTQQDPRAQRKAKGAHYSDQIKVFFSFHTHHLILGQAQSDP